MSSPSSERQESLFSAMCPLDWVLVTAVSVSFFLLCRHFSASRLPWADELLGYRCFAARTLRGTLRGWYQGADGGGLLYYVLGREWMRLFGLSPLALRTYSTTGIVAALVLIWAVVRRYASTAATCFAVTIVFFTAPPMLWQEINGRFYGMFLAAAALVAAEFLVTARRKPQPLDYLLTFVGHGLLLGSHILGAVYSFSFLLALVGFDLYRRLRPRWALYLAGVSAWALVPLSWHAIHATTSVATRVFWTQRPGWRDLLLGIAVSSKVPSAALMALVVVIALLSFRRRIRLPLDAAAVTMLLSLLASELLLFAKSQVSISLFSDRYLLPLAIGTTLLLAVLSEALLCRIATKLHFLPAFSPALEAVLLITGCVYAADRHVHFDLYPSISYPSSVAAQLPANIPVVTTLLPTFNLFDLYDPAHRYFYETDWGYNNMPEHASGDYSGERLMENRKRAGYDASRILSCHELFSSQPKVTLLLAKGLEPWLEFRFRGNPHFRVQQIGADAQWTPFTIWSIQRVAPVLPPC